MSTGYKSSPRVHVIRIVLTLTVLLLGGALLREFFLPDDFGQFGHYRPGAIEDEAARQVRHRANESCFECHPRIRRLHEAGIHKNVSCEACHGAYGDHVQGETVFAAMPVMRGEEIRELCLRCHNRIIQARSPESIKMVALPAHLEDRKVGSHHVCNQCHHVHAPLKWVQEAREMMGLPKEGRDS